MPANPPTEETGSMPGGASAAQVLMGMEMECGFAVLKKRLCRLDHSTALARFAETVARLEPHLPGLESNGIFLQTGGRFYTDCGHPEITTPECSRPEEAVRYKLAAEAILSRAAQALNRETAPDAEVLLFGNNFDYLSGTTWGCHESYLHRAEPELFQRHLVPHLVSRIVYTGCGGFATIGNCFGFLLSPRVAALTTLVSRESTHSRGILHAREESLSGPGYRRAHIICGENNRSQEATYLKLGATSLVIRLVEQGLQPGNEVAFLDPLGAMRLFASDPACKAAAPAGSGLLLTALQVQWHYLDLVRANLGRTFMPAWAPALVDRWAATLTRLEVGPEAVRTRLDWAMKYDLYGRFARERGAQLRMFSAWTKAPPPDDPEADWGGDAGSIRRMLARIRSRRTSEPASVEF